MTYENKPGTSPKPGNGPKAEARRSQDMKVTRVYSTGQVPDVNKTQVKPR